MSDLKPLGGFITEQMSNLKWRLGIGAIVCVIIFIALSLLASCVAPVTVCDDVTGQCQVLRPTKTPQPTQTPRVRTVQTTFNADRRYLDNSQNTIHLSCQNDKGQLSETLTISLHGVSDYAVFDLSEKGIVRESGQSNHIRQIEYEPITVTSLTKRYTIHVLNIDIDRDNKKCTYQYFYTVQALLDNGLTPPTKSDTMSLTTEE